MIGLVIVTQGGLGLEMKATLEHVMGRRQSQLELVSIAGDPDAARDRAKLVEAVGQVDSGDGVVVLTDMLDAPASDLALSLVNGGKLEVIAGVNLPTLVKLATIRDKCSVAEAAIAAQESGRKHIRYYPEAAAPFSQS
jgi:PTS system mannose-specific IIA component